LTPKNTDSSSRGWYTVSVETLRALAVFSTVLALTAVGWALYRRWSEARLAEETRQLLQEVESLLETARQEAEPNAPFSEELESARGNYEEAKAALAAKEFRKAATAARRSYDLLTALFDAATARGAGEAQFIAVQGRVEFRRGERGDWEEARSRTVLYSGDYVKTASNGSAEIVFLDGTLYTVRPNTLFVVARSSRSLSGAEQTIRMEYGWVNLNTAQRTSRIATPKAEARIGQESEASVVFDRESKLGRYVSFRGTVEVKDEAGTVRQLKALEQVTEENGRLSEPRPIPKPPILLSPGDNHVAVLGQDTTLELRWEPVEGADRYLLQVSRNRLFVDNIIDVANRRKTVATLGLRGEGTFEWRAAAQTRDGIQGPWSTPRTFRVVGAPSEADQGDRTPPILELDRVQSLGAFVLVSGRTEPGARVFINGEETAVAANGTFSKTIELQNEGWNFVELIAVDASGNQMKRQQRVFLESL
jgi:hypothetical protein